MKRIGILAGTFDPIHEGHIGFCLEAAERGHLEKVYILPEREPRFKQHVGMFTARIAAIKEAIAPHPNLGIITLDEPYFSVATTLPQLHAQFDPARITLLIGSDVACMSLPNWQNLESLTMEVDFIVSIRGDSTVRDVQQCMRNIETHYPTFRYTIIDSPHRDVSSSKIREER